MDFTKYQEVAATTAVFPKDMAAAYLALGLSGEAGEVAEEVKKCIRNGSSPSGSDFPDTRIENLFEEIGDVLWYIANLCTALGFPLEEVASANVKKLQKRYNND